MIVNLRLDIDSLPTASTAGDLVWVADKSDSNYGRYGVIENYHRLLRPLRSDWQEKMSLNPPFGDRLYVVVQFGGGGGDIWWSLYHVSQLICVRHLGIAVIKHIELEKDGE